MTHDEGGAALIIALMAVALLSALGLGLALSTMTDALVAGSFGVAQETLYAADGAIELGVAELARNADWNGMLRGSVASTFVDGPGDGQRTLPDGSTLDLAAATNVLDCNHPQPCSIAEMDASVGVRQWGANNPRWQLFAWGPLKRALTTSGRSVASDIYTVVWIGDDQAENDGDPTTDGTTAANPGENTVVLHAEAYGVRGARKVIEATVTRRADAGAIGSVRIVSWRTLTP